MSTRIEQNPVDFPISDITFHAKAFLIKVAESRQSPGIYN